MAKSKAVANRGFVNNTILECLVSGDKYGYEIIKEVEDKSNGKIQLKQPSLYSSLKRFEGKGFITSYWGDSDIGGRRHYYSITEVGKNYYYNVVLKDPTLNIKINLPKEKKKTPPKAEVKETYNTDDENYNIFDILENDSDPETYENEIVVEEDVNELEEVDNLNVDEVFEEKNINEETKEEIEETLTPEIDEVIKQHEEELNKEEALQAEIKNNEYMEQSEENFKEAEENLTDMHPTLFAISKRENENSSNVAIQQSMFSEPSEQNIIEINEEERINLNTLKELKNLFNNKENTETENTEDISNKKEIPLVEEKEHEMFSWEDLKRKTQNTKSYSEFSEEETNNSNINASAPPTQPEKQVVVDEFGIVKLQNDEKTNSNNKIFDNVILRTDNDPNDVFKKNKQVASYKQEPELSREEKMQRQEIFIQRFDKIAKSKQQENVADIDYKHILGDLYTNEEENVEPNVYEEVNENVQVEEVSNITFENTSTDVITMDGEEYAQVTMFPKTNKQLYKNHEETLINEGIKLKTYNANSSSNLENKDFVLSNKAKFFVALVLGLLSILEIVAVTLILKTKELFTVIDSKFSIAYYCIIAFIMLIFSVMFIVNPHKRKTNDFKLSYYCIFGALAFISISLLGYAICVFSGLTSLNVNLYLFRIIAPIVVSFNLVIAPLMYNILLKDKRFY